MKCVVIHSNTSTVKANFPDYACFCDHFYHGKIWLSDSELDKILLRCAEELDVAVSNLTNYKHTIKDTTKEKELVIIGENH